tara:strand:- start:247 stop:555 length:309 start_codon:yes stop_codon:yes gene_type:complete
LGKGKQVNSNFVFWEVREITTLEKRPDFSKRPESELNEPDKLGIAILSNQHNSILPYIIADIITNRMLDLPKTELEDYPVIVSDIYTNDNENKDLNSKKANA